MSNTNNLSQVLGVFEFTGGKTIGDRRDGDCGIAERLVGCPGDNRTINPSRVSNGDASVRLQCLDQAVALGFQRWFASDPSASSSRCTSFGIRRECSSKAERHTLTF